MKLTKYLLISSLLIISSSAFAIDRISLSNNEWRMISLPANPGANNTVEDIFGDDIAPADYGKDNKWVVYFYNTTSHSYEPLALDSRLEQGKGYWIIQATGRLVILDMPQSSTDTSPEFSIHIVPPISTAKGRETQWNLVGYPFEDSRKLGNFRVQSSQGVCNTWGCNIDQAKTEDLLHNEVWTYNGRDYVRKNKDDNLSSWDAFWVAALKGSVGQSLALTYDEQQIPALSNADIQRFLKLVNDVRGVARTCGARGDFPAVPALTWSDKLYKASYEHSQDMAISNTFSHSGSGKASDWTGYKLNKQSSIIERIASYNYDWSAIAENIAAGNETAEATIQQWLNSDGHCANMMRRNVTQIGMAKASSNSGYLHYWTQNFGTPR